MDKLEFPAHVDHHVTHGAATGTLILGAAGAVLAAAIIITAAPEAITVAVVAEAAGAASLTGKIGMAIGGVVDGFTAETSSYTLKSGFETVLLDKVIKPAARADKEDTWADCDGKESGYGWEGSKTVLLGKEHEPMSRRTDRLHCQAVISEGVQTIFVGGPSSQEGKSLAETDRASVKVLSAVLDALDLGKTAEEGAVFKALIKATALGAHLTGHDEVGDAIGGVPLDKPTGLASAYQAASDAYKGIGAAGSLVNGGNE